VTRNSKSKRTAQKAPNLSPTGREIVAALAEFRDTLRRDESIERRYTVRTVRLGSRPKAPLAVDARKVRHVLGASQAVFADLLGVSVATIRSWEQGLRKPSRMARRFLSEIASDPEYWRACFK